MFLPRCQVSKEAVASKHLSPKPMVQGERHSSAAGVEIETCLYVALRFFWGRISGGSGFGLSDIPGVTRVLYRVIGRPGESNGKTVDNGTDAEFIRRGSIGMISNIMVMV